QSENQFQAELELPHVDVDGGQEQVGIEIDVGIGNAVERKEVKLAAHAGHRELLLGAVAALARAGAPKLLAKLALTLGLSAMSEMKLRPFSGRSTIRRFSITVPTVAFSVASRGAPPVTSTVSASDPTLSWKSMRATCCTCSSTLVRFSV